MYNSQIKQARMTTLILLLALTWLVNPLTHVSATSTTINHIAWSPDGSKIAGATDNGLVIWNSSTHQEIATLGAPEQYVELAWSPDNLKVAVGKENGQIDIWNVATQQLVHTLNGHTNVIEGIAWSSDGTKIYSTDYRGILLVRNSVTYEQVGYNANGGFAIAESPDGTTIVLGTTGGIELHDATTGDYIAHSEEVLTHVTSVDWSPDGTKIVSGDFDQKVRIWDAATRQVLFTFEQHTATVTSVSWHPNGERILSADYNGNIFSWDPVTGDYVKLNVQSRNVKWSEDGTSYAYAVDDDEIAIKSTLSAIPPADRTDPTLISPSSGGSLTSGYPEYVFWPANGMTSYLVYGTNNGAGGTANPFGVNGTWYYAPDVCDDQTGICTIPIGSTEYWRYLTNGPDYEWTVRGYDAQGGSTTEQAMSFSVNVPVPPKPTNLYSPALPWLVSDQDHHFTLTWDDMPDTDFYRVVASLSSVWVYETDWLWQGDICADGVCTFQAISNADTYDQLWVQGYGPGGTGPWSDPFGGGSGSLLVGNEPPPEDTYPSGSDPSKSDNTPPSTDACDYFGCELPPGVKPAD